LRVRIVTNSFAGTGQEADRANATRAIVLGTETQFAVTTAGTTTAGTTTAEATQTEEETAAGTDRVLRFGIRGGRLLLGSGMTGNKKHKTATTGIEPTTDTSRSGAAVVTAVTIVGVVLRAGVTGATTVLPGTAHHRDAAATTPMARRLLPRRARDPRSPSRRMRKRLRTSDAWRLRWRRWRMTMRMTK
jgi:hypothetical protein